MTPHKQLITHAPEQGQFGDCFRTCIAVVLDLEPAQVPHFYETGTFDGDGVRSFLLGKGLAEFEFSMDAGMELEKALEIAGSFGPGVPMILTGRSRIDVNHCVVVLDGKIVCDPSGNGIVGPTPENGYWFSVLARAG